MNFPALLVFALAVGDGDPTKIEVKATPKVPIGKDTTFIIGPIDDDGYLDFETALNDRLSKGVTPENNANTLIWTAFGPTPEGGNPMPEEFYRRLGVRPPPEGAYLISSANS